ncbi:MAG: hypothetical protein J6R96_03860, partial [Spirochaetaceae bacterium]|nr:hypothetical protein [Spirochaetaceae bacterium]
YSKAIFQDKSQDWIFVEAPLYLDEATFLPVTAAGVPPEVLENLSGPSQFLQFSGSVWQEGRHIPEITCSIEDFVMSEGSCTLAVSYKDETRQITLHPVEMWSFMFRNNPGFDGTPKNFFITFEYPEESLYSKYPEFQLFLKKVFGDKNKVVFSSQASVTDSVFHLSVKYKEPQLVPTPLSSRGDATIPAVAAAKPRKDDFVFVLTSSSSQQEAATVNAALFYDSPALAHFSSEELQLAPGTLIYQGNRQLLDKALVANKQYHQMLLQELDLFKKYASKAKISRWGYNFVDLLTTVTLLNQIDLPKIKTATSFGGELLAQNARTYKAQAQSRTWTYSHLLELLEIRIAAYKALQKVLEEDEAVVVPEKLFDSHYQYLKSAQLPDSIQGISPLQEDCCVTAYLLPDVPLFPGYCLVLQQEGEFYYVLAELEQSVKTIYHRKNQPSQENPLVLTVKFQVFSDSGLLPKALKKLDKQQGRLMWDGNQLVIEGKKGLLKNTPLFLGRMKIE